MDGFSRRPKPVVNAVTGQADLTSRTPCGALESGCRGDSPVPLMRDRPPAPGRAIPCRYRVDTIRAGDIEEEKADDADRAVQASWSAYG